MTDPSDLPPAPSEGFLAKLAAQGAIPGVAPAEVAELSAGDDEDGPPRPRPANIPTMKAVNPRPGRQR